MSNESTPHDSSWQSHENESTGGMVHVSTQSGDVEASVPQQLMWLHNELVRVPLYNEPIVVQYHGDLDVVALQNTFNYVVERHEAWRTGFEWKDGLLIQRVWPATPVSLSLIDLRGLSSQQQEEHVYRGAREDAQKSFDLSQPPLFRLRLFRLADSEYRLHLTIHHIICDGVSIGQIFLKEITTAYAAYQKSEVPSADPLPMQYREYAAALPTRADAGAVGRSLQYWTEKLAGNLPSTSLPLDYSRPENRSYAGTTLPFSLNGETTKALKDLSRRARTTLPVTLLALCHIALYRHNGETDQIVGTVTSDRKQAETRNLLGLFLNTVVLRTAFDPDDSFLALLARVRETMLDAMSHDILPFSQLVNRFERERVPGKSPLFQIMYAPQPYHQSQGNEWEISQMAVDTGLSKFDLNFELEAGGEQVRGRIHYSSELFRQETVSRFRDDWQFLASLVIIQPEAKISELIQSLPVYRNQNNGKQTASLWQRFLASVSLKRTGTNDK